MSATVCNSYSSAKVTSFCAGNPVVFNFFSLIFYSLLVLCTNRRIPDQLVIGK